MKPKLIHFCKPLLSICLVLMAIGASAQTYNNEWIDFNKSYFKFKVGADGLYRIPQTVLANAGIGSTPAQYFQLFRNGVEVAVYTSVASGPLGSNDYIEFWGQMNDGKPDKPLYRDPAYQHTDKWSLETDTATYFLTVNTTGTPLHYTVQSSDTSANVLPVEAYFMYKTGSYFRTQINPGFAEVIEEYIYSSAYDQGEFFSSDFVSPGAPLSDNQNNLFVYPAGPSADVKFGAVGCSDTLRRIQVKLNNSLIKDTALNSFNDIVRDIPVSVASLNTSSTNVQFINLSQATTYSDRLVVSFYEINYPRQFNFGGLSNFQFTLPAKASGYFLRISNFNAGASTPVLYDMVTGQRFNALLTGSTLTFLLGGTVVDRQLVLVNEDLSNIKTITGLTQKNFVQFSDPISQGNYLIISNPQLYTGSNGNNPVVDYKNYRSSTQGGGYNAQIMEVGELVDQFGFGIKKHPLSVKNFLNYARNTFAIKPQFVLLLGRGMAYNDYRTNEADPATDQLDVVPSFGFPASDVMLSSQDGAHPVALTPIGRIGAISGPEVEIYLNKVKEYEAAQQNGINDFANRAWRKNIIHVTGATDPFLESILCNSMASYAQIISDTLFGANVYRFCASTVDANNQVSANLFPSLFVSGLGMLTYYGHSSASSLGFNLDDPSVYNNQGKYPVFYVNGCYAGNYYTYDPGRLTLSKTLSESYVLIKDKGSIAFVASTHFGVVNYLNIILTNLYNLLSHEDYGKQIGIVQLDAAARTVAALPLDFLARAHAEEMNIHGDPALTISEAKLPDYDIESPNVVVSPSFISVSDNSFKLSATFYNLGKAVDDSITVLITRKFPDGSSAVVLRKRQLAPKYSDSLQLDIPIVATRDKGTNTLTITVNADNDVTETTLNNNTVSLSVFIYQDELTPIYPYNYAITTIPNQKLYASTSNPFAPSIPYAMELDTTELFNSTSKVSKTVNSIGGLLEFDPGILYQDSTVYYWRTSIVPTGTNTYHWNEFSFVYIDSLRSGPGFNQSHYYQHLKSLLSGVNLTADRKWQYTLHNDELYIKNGVFPTAANSASDLEIEVNGSSGAIASVCGIGNVIFNVFDPITFQPWFNVASGPGQYNSDAVCGTTRQYNFQFDITTQAKRKSIVDFLDLIPNGYYVVMRNTSGTDPASNTYASDWIKDTTFLGSGNSMYQRLVAQGFTGIDSFYKPRAFIFTYQKNSQATFTPKFIFSTDIYDKIFIDDKDYVSPDSLGFVTSPVFGPAKQWKQVHWRGSSTESPSTDSVILTVTGIDTSGNQTTIANLNRSNQDYDISTVNAQQFPYIQLKLNESDNKHATPYQLKYWRLNYVPVPEGALAPNIFLSSKDSLELGEKLEFGIAFKNISITAFDSMRINLVITDKNNVGHTIIVPKRRPIISGDTLKLSFEIDTKDYPGLNTIYLDVNPANDQPEQYHFNNFLYKNFFVKVDKTNPLLDVTFDNVHILNEDIVSAKPHILIKLKDEAKFLLLSDTSVLKVQLRYPDGTLHPYFFNNDTLRFTPATSSADNTASVEFDPAFLKQFNPEGDDYTLIVTGSDKSGNASGTISYQVTFKIITKAMISNMLNYPNPFTTSTAFVFTITGSDVPQNIKIQILTITGKVVREVTKDELGPLHVGRNITEFKWDGTDTYHQRLGIGVYLYHVVTNLNGKSLDKYKAQGDNTDQYFIKGYGKMYMMK